jgi:hypothetical protein
MRLIGFIVCACFALAVLKAAIVALLVACLLGALTGLIYRPRETLGFIFIVLIGGLVQSHGTALLVVIGVIVFASILQR